MDKKKQDEKIEKGKKSRKGSGKASKPKHPHPSPKRPPGEPVLPRQYGLTESTDKISQYERLIKIIPRLIEKNHIIILEKLLANLRPADISYVSEFLDEKQKSITFSLIPHTAMAEILPEISKDNRATIFEERDPRWLAKVVDQMDSNDAADILAEMPREKTSFILKKMDLADAFAIRNLLKYDENSAGGIMAAEFLAVSEDATVSEIISEFKILAEKEDIEDLHSSFVINKDGKLLGLVPLRKLILYRGNTNVTQILEKDIISINVKFDQEEVAAIFKRHNLITAPVVDDENHLLGRITIDDIVDVIDEETSEDIYRMAGVSSDSSIHSSVRSNIRRRIPWLMVNLATATISASVVSMYEGVIEKVAILAAFMPIVAGLGGNAGAQVIAIAVRSIALGELTFANAGRVLRREISTGALNGILLGIIVGLGTALITGKVYLGVVISGAMMMNVFTATIAGFLVPLGLKKLGVDPAVAANIFVTPMTDSLGFFFFLGLAKVFLVYLY
jgi:magnesium transporter